MDVLRGWVFLLCWSHQVRDWYHTASESCSLTACTSPALKLLASTGAGSGHHLRSAGCTQLWGGDSGLWPLCLEKATLRQNHIRIELHLTEAGDRAGWGEQGWGSLIKLNPRCLCSLSFVFKWCLLQIKSLGQGMMVIGLFKQHVLQFCVKTLVKKCKELWFVFCSHIRVRVEDVSLHRSVLHGSRKQQECAFVWDSYMERSCAFLVWFVECISMSTSKLGVSLTGAPKNPAQLMNWWPISMNLGRVKGYWGSFNMKSCIFWRKKVERRGACFLAEWSDRLMKICCRNQQLNSAGSVLLCFSSVYGWR